MKKIFVFFALLAAHLGAQDTLRFKNGEVQAVKVNEIGINEIKYNRFDNQDGPNYIIQKSEIVSIKYKNGQIDNFGTATTGISVIPHESVTITTLTNDKMFMHGNKIMFHSKALSEPRLKKLIYSHNDLDKQAKLNAVFNEMIKYKRKQHTAFSLGLGLGLGIPFVGLVAAIASESVGPLMGGVLIGTAVGVTGGVISGINKKKRIEKMKEITQIYNGEK